MASGLEEALSMFVPRTSHRFFARVIDAVIVFAFWVPLLGASTMDFLSADRWWMSWPYFLYFLTAPLVYEGLCLTFFGTTFGKWVFFLRVVPSGDSSRRLTMLESFTRVLAMELNLFFSWAVQALALLQPDRRHLADWIARTRVVSLRPRPFPPRIRWFWSSLLIASLAWSGWSHGRTLMRSLHWDRLGVSVISQ